ncbi:helix-turn-helix domain-containing protein [Cohnella nanjingensis]|uniref:Helix-turn-helix domain-containing protein n=1 Tax=Cohnella nanjingensis TaxID=1387779 RepID=A0A7X0RSR3_9BACL|nr:helix-turn-helix domain-containing protein [Cohnella nanjingensis]MBB6672846.1 helix-turn-helix domain-containing protein [Cohnella nanjingensis]
MSDLGLLLRKAREQRGYTLDDIQELTKIRKRYLEAIESGDYKVLPGSFYVRAFVKTYAETVGLDAEEVLRLYHKELPVPPTAETVPSEPMLQSKSRSVQHNDRWGKVAVTLLMWLFPILIIVVVYVYLLNNKDHTPPKTSDQDTQITQGTSSPSAGASPTPTPTATPTPTPPPAATTVTFKEKKGSRYYYEVAPAGPHTLTITFPGGKSWVGVNENSASGKSLYNKTPSADETLTFEMKGPIYVNVGNAKGAQIAIDGVAVDDGDTAGSKKFIFTPLEGAATPTPTP